jgi:hypothetical protein
VKASSGLLTFDQLTHDYQNGTLRFASPGRCFAVCDWGIFAITMYDFNLCISDRHLLTLYSSDRRYVSFIHLPCLIQRLRGLARALGGYLWNGPYTCPCGQTCVEQNTYFFECVGTICPPPPPPPPPPAGAQCMSPSQSTPLYSPSSFFVRWKVVDICGVVLIRVLRDSIASSRIRTFSRANTISGKRAALNYMQSSE